LLQTSRIPDLVQFYNHVHGNSRGTVSAVPSVSPRLRGKPGGQNLHSIQDIGVASQIGAYSDAIVTRPNLRWLITSGTPGLSAAGELPDDIVGQSEIAWEHIGRLLAQAGMTVSDIVKVTQYLTRAEDVKAYAAVRTRFLREARPASMLLVIPQLVWPEILVEVEILAARGD
jgi:2-iminobutanoate/2-iminopropanoate deaminase